MDLLRNGLRCCGLERERKLPCKCPYSLEQQMSQAQGIQSPSPQGVWDPHNGESAHRCTWEGQGAAGRQICSRLAVTVFAQFSMRSYHPFFILRELGPSTIKVSPRQMFVIPGVRLISYWSLLTLLHHW
jgi:hypothetical protein